MAIYTLTMREVKRDIAWKHQKRSADTIRKQQDIIASLKTQLGKVKYG